MRCVVSPLGCFALTCCCAWRLLVSVGHDLFMTYQRSTGVLAGMCFAGCWPCGHSAGGGRCRSCLVGRVAAIESLVGRVAPVDWFWPFGHAISVGRCGSLFGWPHSGHCFGWPRSGHDLLADRSPFAAAGCWLAGRGAASAAVTV